MSLALSRSNKALTEKNNLENKMVCHALLMYFAVFLLFSYKAWDVAAEKSTLIISRASQTLPTSSFTKWTPVVLQKDMSYGVFEALLRIHLNVGVSQLATEELCPTCGCGVCVCFNRMIWICAYPLTSLRAELYASSCRVKWTCCGPKARLIGNWTGNLQGHTDWISSWPF